MIGYLEMNRELPRDDEAVEQALVVIGDEKVAELHTLDTKYRTAGHIAMGSFAVNTIPLRVSDCSELFGRKNIHSIFDECDIRDIKTDGGSRDCQHKT